MRVRPYAEADAARWDELVGRSAAGTFLHTRRFLSYHGNRFQDLSLICEDAKGQVIAVFPAALMPGDATCVASHPGATYGGLIHGRDVAASNVEEMLAGIVAHYELKVMKRLEYKSVPPHLQSSYAQADVHAIWKRGAAIVRRDLWSVVPLRSATGYSEHHKRDLARALKVGGGVSVVSSDAEYREFHAVLEQCLAERHAASPVHTPEEMLALRDRFPQDIALWLTRDSGGQILAGCWVFMFPGKAWHTQYIATSLAGRSRGAAYVVLDEIIRAALERTVPFLSFGASTEEGGRKLNSGLFEFKAGFGAGTVCHDTYCVELR